MKVKKTPFPLSVSVISASILITSAVSIFLQPIAAIAQPSVKRPTIAKVQSMVNGDLMCYVTLVGDNRTVYKSVGADFEICAKKKTFLNKRVRLSYGTVRVNDCRSAEPCGKTRQETLITKMQIVARNGG